VQTSVVATADPPDASSPQTTRTKPGLFSKAASRLALHLSPVAKAEAATLPSEPLRPGPNSERWGIQLGAFHAPAAAQKAALDAASLAIAKGKPMQIVEPGKGNGKLYRARLLNFTPREAQSACAQLHKKKIECSVVAPTAPKVAAR
jgi:cell division protein FtsN